MTRSLVIVAVTLIVLLLAWLAIEFSDNAVEPDSLERIDSPWVAAVAEPPTTTTVARARTAPTVRTQSATPPLIAGTPSDADFDQLAQCESGGNWQANTGNGYYGGLQFAASTWRRAGGTRYAAYAHQASREQQIEIARAWLAKTSWAQWPTCSRRLGWR